MQTYISFLRGVNMAGHNSIKMPELSVLFKNLGFSDTKTYIQSGNVIFSSADQIPVTDLSAKIENGILKRFNFTVPALIRTLNEILQVITVNPFLLQKNSDPTKMAVIFLQSAPSEDQIRKVEDINYPPDKFEIIDREIFIYCPNGFGKTKLYTNFFEKKMGVIGTARNWKTITTLAGMAEFRVRG
jgi:uncharacterized protein (DUF1697 family)